MDFTLSRQHEMLRDMVRQFAETEIAPRVLELETKCEFPYDVVKRLAELGLIGIFVPKVYGGSDMGHLARMISLEEVSRVYATLGLILEATQNTCYALLVGGSEEQKQKYLLPICKAEKITCFGFTEPSGGSDAAGMQSMAVIDGDYYVLNGRKAFITMALVADITGVMTKSSDGYDIFVIERGTPGLEAKRRENMLAFRSVPIGEIVMTDCRIPQTNRIGDRGDGMALGKAQLEALGRPGIAGISLGIAQGAYESALKFAKERILYGKPIATLQAIQFKLADMETEIDAARFLAYHAAWLVDQGKSSRETLVPIAKAKLFASEMATRVCVEGVRIMGGYGLSSEYYMIHRLNDALGLIPGGGTSEIMRLIISREAIR